MTKSTLRTITGYSETVDLKYLASTLNDKEKTAKSLEKQLRHDLLDEDFFRIKKAPRDVVLNITSEEGKNEACQKCFEYENRQPQKRNYYLDLLDSKELLLLRGSSPLALNSLNLLFTKNKTSIDVSEKIPQNTEFIEFLEKCDKCSNNDTINYETMIKWVKDEASRYTYEFSSKIFKCLGIIIYNVSRFFIDRVIVSSTEMRRINETNAKNNPVVYILKNQSSFDWFLILSILVFCKMKVPVVMLYKDKNSTLSWMYKKLGVIFIRSRRDDVDEEDPKHIIYDEAWLYNVDENLKANNHIMFYLNCPDDSCDYDIISAMMDSVRRKTVTDVAVVPVKISYERKPSMENSSANYFSIFARIMRMRLGLLRVNFLNPFSLKELMASLCGKTARDVYELTEDENYNLTPKVVSHIDYDFCNTIPVMCTNLLSYLLLHKFRNGTKFEDLITEMDELRSELLHLNKRLGFTGNSSCVINHAVNVLGPQLVTVTIQENGDRIIAPVSKLPFILEMFSYSRESASYFMMRAVILSSTRTIFKNEFQDAFKSKKELKFTYDSLFDHVKKLCNLLHFEHVFVKPCRSLEDEFNDVLLKCCNEDLFIKHEKLMTEEELWGHRVAQHLEEIDSFDEDTDDGFDYRENDDSQSPPRLIHHKIDDSDSYLINMKSSKSVVEEMNFYQNLLAVYLDTYAVSAEHLSTLINKQVPETYFSKTLTDKLNMMLDANQLRYAESTSPVILKNSIRLFLKRNIIKSYSIGGVKLLSLDQNYNDKNKLSSLVEEFIVYQ